MFFKILLIRSDDMRLSISNMFFRFGLVAGLLLTTAIPVETVAQKQADEVIFSSLDPDTLTDADTAFEDFLRIQLQSLHGIRMSAPAHQWLNAELSACLWQWFAGEEDCAATDNETFYPLQAYSDDGTLLSQALPLTKWDSLRDLEHQLLDHRKREGAFSINRTRCTGFGEMGCVFQVATAFRAHCAGGADVCGRAESIELFYAILFNPNSTNLRKRRVLTNIGQTDKKIIIQTEQVIRLGPLQCPHPKQILAGYDAKRQPRCYFRHQDLIDACLAQPDGIGLQQFVPDLTGECKPEKNSPSSCKTLCEKFTRVNFELACERTQVRHDLRNPFVSDCADGFAYWQESIKEGPDPNTFSCGKGLVQLGQGNLNDCCRINFFNTCLWSSPQYEFICADEREILWSNRGLLDP